jgi:hypothetical protein
LKSEIRNGQLFCGSNPLINVVLQDLTPDLRGSHTLRKIALAAFLKTLLPIEAMISGGFEGAQIFKDQWDEVYGWLSDGERKGLSSLARSIMNLEVRTFQERLEQAAFRLITKTFL